MTQIELLSPTKPPERPGINLHLGDVREVSLPQADLAIIDPPWWYNQKKGQRIKYPGLRTSEIGFIFNEIRKKTKNIALWVTAPIMPEWLDLFPKFTTMGTWAKSEDDGTGQYGQGYWWAGNAEYVLLYPGKGAYNSASKLRSSCVEPPTQHSRKPVSWQAQMVKRWCPPGGLVIDPFAGLGSVAEATIVAGAGRRYEGWEIDPVRHEQALALIAQAREQS